MTGCCKQPVYATVLGVRFLNMKPPEAVATVLAGGLLVVPSGPGLATLDRDQSYRDALLGADYAIVDSGYLALLSRLFGLGKLERISGLEFIDAFLNQETRRGASSSFWLMPREEECAATLRHLSNRGISVPIDNIFVAPMYPSDGPVEDPELLAKLDALQPQFVILNIAGGKQEKLGRYLQKNLSYKPAIICTGAAIAFLTGHQAKIPMWADRLYLGWLWRCIDKPSVYIPRYWSAIRLAYLVFRYKEKLPPVKVEKA
ncbi:MAG: WecB/TagA/CpsF family glycosyltransferase [Kiritimatiellia bacterium]|jgi:UDP-N-acetyl-D-mannosaminuronic acid transferase (WecB/TagA/CpsF family)|nr:WecB/TagA/CpsF family glycosyltransferase [Kiritimatiellia bacterium]MDP6809654.1 WecB/TagA/CpsF family glycosyltransferase [Kiritimatiellia bacterium]MDP7023496.1 WecB/TagA/CpsF family glycosyltransferase [Kiritimatiellia bacterium]